MSNKVQLKRSSVPAKVPATTDLDLGELGINTYDGKMYIKKDDGTESIVEIGAGSGGTALTIKDENSVITTTANTISFVGAGVNASGTGTDITVTISGGSFDQSNVAITGGTINGTSIGATTQSTGFFSNVAATGNSFFNSTDDATADYTGAVQVAGGMSVAKAIRANTLVTSNDITVAGSMTVGHGSGNDADNLAFGSFALSTLQARTDISDFSKAFNLAIGARALQNLPIGTNNTAIGGLAMFESTTGAEFNIALGAHALQELRTGTNNIGIGAFCGGGNWETYLSSGSNNIYLGNFTKPLTSGENNAIIIGNSATSLGSNAIVIGNSSHTQTKLFGNVTVTGTVTANGVLLGAGGGTSLVGNTTSSTTSLGFGAASTTPTLTGATAIGVNALSAHDNYATNPVAVGANAMQTSKVAQSAVAVGTNALQQSGQLVNATAIIVGKRYTIAVPGDTNWVSIGAANNNLYTSFYATAVGTGTGTAAVGGRNITALGTNAGQNNLTGNGMTLIGTSAAAANKYGEQITVIGNSNLFQATAPDFVTALGSGAMLNSGNNVASTALVTGQKYMITSIGTTDWTTCGATTNTLGHKFTATGTATGTGTAGPTMEYTTSVGYRAGSGQTVTGLPNGNSPTDATTSGERNVFLGSLTKPSGAHDNNTIVIGYAAAGKGSNTTVIGNSNTSQTYIPNGTLVLAKTASTGIQVDTATPSWGWRDLLGQIQIRGSGIQDPTWSQYNGVIYQYRFNNNDEFTITFHLPHDYVPGTDIHAHVHWSLNAAGVTENVTWEFSSAVAKGFDQAAFSPTLAVTSVTQTSSTTQYQHMIAETVISSATGTAGVLHANSLFEVDGMVIMRVKLSGNTGASQPFVHGCDLHYQSTNMATKGKAPSFYA